MNIRKTITSEIEWNTIKKAQADGKLQELLQVGDELDITLKTGEELTVQAVGTTERGLIFLLKDCMKDKHGMNKRMTSKGGWRDSEMRLWLNETIIHMLPDDLREMIVPRRIVQTMDGERLVGARSEWQQLRVFLLCRQRRRRLLQRREHCDWRGLRLLPLI